MHCASTAGKLLIDHVIPNTDMQGTSASGQILTDDIPQVARDAQTLCTGIRFKGSASDRRVLILKSTGLSDPVYKDYV